MTDLAFGSFHLTRPTLFHFYANRNWLENASAELFELISSEKIKLDQVTKYPLENVAQAHTDIENRNDRLSYPRDLTSSKTFLSVLSSVSKIIPISTSVVIKGGQRTIDGPKGLQINPFSIH